ncbi:hypothetical protein QQP08_023126 [Theobroma cacao]|nr:hypothetical protein QQP08_023126 [Theobroma cacao]
MGKKSESPITLTPPPRRRETQLVSPLPPVAPMKTESPVYYYNIYGKRIPISKNTYYSLLVDALNAKFEPLLLSRPEEDPETAHRRKIKILMSMR